ncbi:MAG: tripartite tricarboxylate transporter TctB family protein, partial [Hyphomicrobiales bacterium]|nr:tripartite tricarboxylate transporter TctB family protein [Hyphomicrobiales bacterium]
ATTYDIGTLREMGPGFFPLALSILIAGLGVAIVAGAGRAQPQDAYGPMAHAHRTGADLRGWTAIIAGVVAFIGLGAFAGMAPATFACVFIAALGDRQNTWKSAAVLAFGLTIFAVVALAWGLRVQMPVFRGI